MYKKLRRLCKELLVGVRTEETTTQGGPRNVTGVLDDLGTQQDLQARVKKTTSPSAKACSSSVDIGNDGNGNVRYLGRILHAASVTNCEH